MTLGHLARFPRLRHLRISCMPLPAVPFSAESLWHLVALPSPPALRCDPSLVYNPRHQAAGLNTEYVSH